MRTLNVIELLQEKGLFLVTVESCTGGSLVAALTDVPGASTVVADSFVVYCNEAKIKLGVPAEILTKHSVYSLETATAMAQAGIQQSVRATLGIGITGSLSRVDPANPDSSNVGEVFMALVKDQHVVARRYLRTTKTDRVAAKQQIVQVAMEMLELALLTDFSYTEDCP